MSLPGWLAKGSRVREWTKDGLARSAALGLGTITRVETREPAVALTFDDGPHPEWTPRFLDVLARGGARGTFFMVGKSARRHPEVAARVVREGHCAANHSWDHPSFPLLKGRWRRRQLRWCQEALPAGAARLFRPPWGHQSLGSRLDAARLGFRVVTWDVVAEDWGKDDARTLAERMEAGIRPGSIAVFHDALYATDDEAHRDRSAALEAVALLLERLAGRYRFVTVPELLRLGRPRYWHWYRRSDLDWLRKQT